ncbi:ankyrin repeat domain-containing protein [Leadbettera azotonutricia]|uniref:Ankyrin repeat protein n=1 Tax=Leadbettera azotonutricia (strain ATCC BAA-888 / DSM 13862 / ZAS-9) TaxID=545695 RepID=F5YE93_LEAAZ|nr:ankyrin repeat domain-containing protein [Leadbettera azotonutricia]AEF83058.1 ankyrin repeat protein [Leadbettera azotonutricia ZAS-9]
MNVVLLYSQNSGKGNFQDLLETFTDLSIAAEAFEAGPGVDISQVFGISPGGETAALFPSHIVVLGSLDPSWLIFAIGFSTGCRIPLLVYGDTAKGLSGEDKKTPAEFSSLLKESSKKLKNKTALIRYFEDEKAAWIKKEAARDAARARDTLLQMGISVTLESLAKCTEEGKALELSLFLASGFHPDTKDKAGVPLLNIAARGGHREAVEVLLKAGAKVNIPSDDRGSSALMDSAMGKHHDMMEDLLKAGADVNIKSKDGQSALILAVGLNDADSVEILLKSGADPDDPDLLGASARKYATLFNRESIVALFNAYAPQNANYEAS